MDQIDRRIIDRLYANSRISYEQLARAVRLSRPAVYERVRRLERDGVIKGYTARVDWAQLGLPLTALVALSYTSVKPDAFITGLEQMSVPGTVITEIHRVTGEYCVIAKARTAGTQALQALIDAIAALPGASGTRTWVVLSSAREEGSAHVSPTAATDATSPFTHASG